MKLITIVLTIIVLIVTIKSTGTQSIDSIITTPITVTKESNINSPSITNQPEIKSETSEQLTTISDHDGDNDGNQQSTLTPVSTSTESVNHDQYDEDSESSESENVTPTNVIETNESDPTISNSTDQDSQDNQEESADEEDEYAYNVNHINQTVELLTRWAKITENAIQMLVSEAMPHATEFGYRFDINEDCILSLLQLVNGFRKQKDWAFKLIDSYGRPSAGSLDGTVNSLGDYDECLGVEFPKYFGEETPITGKYCTVKIDFPVPVKPKRVTFHSQPVIQWNGTHLNETVWGHLFKYVRTAYTLKGFRFGVCIPSTCSADELEPIIRKAASPVLQMPLTFGPDDECTYRSEVIPLTIYSKISLTFFLTAIGIILFSTLLDLIGFTKVNVSPDQPSWWLLSYARLTISCFSFNQANRYLNKSPVTRVNKILDGLTVLTLYSLITGHTYFFGGFYKTTELINRWTEDVPMSVSKITHQLFLNTHLFMDSLFFLSGVSLACAFLPKLSSTKWITKYLIFTFTRWLRFVPLIASVILINYLFPHLGSGPNYKSYVYNIMDNCQNNWWPHFLGIGNWIGSFDKMCAPQLWYLSADLQLHLAGVAIFMCYQRSLNSGLVVNIVIIIVGILSSAASNLYFNSDATFGLNHLVDYESLEYQFDSTYFPTYLHLAPFALGILIGHLIERPSNKCKPLKTSSFMTISIWLFCSALSLTAILAGTLWNNVNVQFDLNISSRVIFAGLQRTLWCSFLAWTVYYFTTSGTNFFVKILASKYFSILSKFSFCIYVIHTIPIDLRTYSFKYTILWDDHFFISWSLLNIILAVVLGYALFFCLEFPIIRMTSLAFGTDSDETDEPKETKSVSQSLSDSRFRFAPRITGLAIRKNGKFQINPRV